MNSMQTEFDAVVAHLFKQGKRAAKGKACLYRTEDGLSCAVGCRIPDDKYDPLMDNSMIDTGVGNLVRRFKTVLPAEIVEYSGMFEALQNVHDSAVRDTNGNFRLDFLAKDLEGVAGQFGLTFTVPAVHG